jgi:HK97 gp10 family phage protein
MAIRGVNEVVAELRKISKDLDKNINATTEEAAFFIEKSAKKLAPRNFGDLAKTISTDDVKTKGLINKKVTVNEIYGAYVEFGTGAKVSVPKEFAEMAASFKGQKTGTFADFIISMTAYFNAKGYDPKNVWIACINILNNGQEARPFLYPSWTEGKKMYLKDLENLLKTYNKKI